MSKSKVARDVMIDVFEFPHVPYWFTVRQTIGIVKKALLGTEKCHYPMAVLVFDEKYNLLGTLGLKDILKGLEPKFLSPTTKAQVPAGDESGLSLLWDTMFDSGAREMAERQVSEVMVPAKQFVGPEDPLTKAAYLMIHHNLVLLPVLEDRKKFVGLLRIVEIFEELSNLVMGEQGA